MRISDWSSDVCSSDLVAQVRLGQAIRYGSPSENGKEVVVGTAIMRIGENSRTVASAVAERLDGINASLPTDVVIQPVLDRTALVNSTIKQVAKNLPEGAMLVLVVLFSSDTRRVGKRWGRS